MKNAWVSAGVSKELSELVLDGDINDLFSRQFCDALAAGFSGNKAVLIRSDNHRQPVVVSSGVDECSVRAYEEYFHLLDPMNAVRTANAALRMSDTVPKKRLEGSEFYQDFFKPMDSYHSLSLTRSICQGSTLEIAINRGVGSDDYTTEDKRLLKQLAAQVAARVGVLESACAISEDYKKDKLEKLGALTERELEVFISVSSGQTLNEFCRVNKISVHTGRTLIKTLRAKLEVESQLELAKIARAIS